MVQPTQHAAGARTRVRDRVLAACAVAALLVALGARVLGPSDAWDQRQPRTIAYTVDIIVNGNWALPEERGLVKATKPPLYNWLAAPVVRMAGFSSDFAHKAPSVVALIACWILVVWWAGRIEPSLGWLAGLILAASYPMFKLGYLARPDMLLTLWLVVAWIAATRLLMQAGAQGEMPAARRWAWALAFWLAVALAALSKGPVALVVVVYAVIAAPSLGGRWSAVNALGWWWGLPLCVLLFGAWVRAVWVLDPDHLALLWSEEIVGRITGLGPEGSRAGPMDLITTAPNMFWYYVIRFLPWSLASLLGIAALWRRLEHGGVRRWRTLGEGGAMLHAAALFTIVVIAFFTCSASKRADYITATFASGAVLAAWWWRERRPRLGRLPWLAPVAAALTLAVLIAYNQLEINAPQRGFGEAIDRFTEDASARMREAPGRLATWSIGVTHVQSYLGGTGRSGHRTVNAAVDHGDPFWLVVGRRTKPPFTIAEWKPDFHRDWTITEICRTERLGRTGDWPEELVLYRAERKPKPGPAP